MAAVERRVATQLVGKSYALAAPLEPSQSEPAVLLDTITPEALGVRGFYLDHTGSPQRHRATICQPLRWLGYKLACLLHEFRPICVCARQVLSAIFRSQPASWLQNQFGL